MTLSYALMLLRESRVTSGDRHNASPVSSFRAFAACNNVQYTVYKPFYFRRMGIGATGQRHIPSRLCMNRKALGSFPFYGNTAVSSARLSSFLFLFWEKTFYLFRSRFITLSTNILLGTSKASFIHWVTADMVWSNSPKIWVDILFGFTVIAGLASNAAINFLMVGL